MSDVPVYVVANFLVHDAAEYHKYEKGFFPVLKRHGGEFFTYDDNTVTFEGTAREGRMVLFRFPSEQAARNWYADPDYQEISEFRRAGTEMQFLTMIHGLPPRK